jgi:hypothetical protein
MNKDIFGSVRRRTACDFPKYFFPEQISKIMHFIRSGVHGKRRLKKTVKMERRKIPPCRNGVEEAMNTAERTWRNSLYKLVPFSSELKTNMSRVLFSPPPQ